MKDNKDNTVTRKQFAAAIFAALLSPLMRVLPRASTALAGKGAWLSVVPAFFALLLLTALMNALRRRLRPGEGLANLILRLFGPILGRLLLLVYGAWFLFYAGFILRSGAERLTATVYQQAGLGPFIIAMLALCLTAALGTLRATARTAVFLRAILVAALGVVTVFSLSGVRAENLFPLSWSDAPRVALGALPVVTVGGVASLFSFLNGYVEPAEHPTKWVARPLAVFSAAAGLLCFVSVGTFGPTFTTRLSYPFFTMIRDVSFFGTAQRVEAIVIALWVFADFILCVMILRCAHEALRTILGLPKPEGFSLFDLRHGRWLVWLEALAAYASNALLVPSAAAFFALSDSIVPLITNILVFGGFSLIWLTAKLRKM